MQIKEGMQDAYSEYVTINSNDGYSKAVIDYTERWADLMEQHFANYAEGGPEHWIALDADRLSSEADKDFGITGFQYGCAVSALAHFWVYGEELRRWHNLKTQIGTEGEKANESGGVLNPALLSFGGGDE